MVDMRPNRKEGRKMAKKKHVFFGNDVKSARLIEVSLLLGVGTVLRLETDAGSMVK